MKRSIVILMALAATLTACNTVNGVGRDIESVGNTVSDAAK